jgi:hypothetical protein
LTGEKGYEYCQQLEDFKYMVNWNTQDNVLRSPSMETKTVISSSTMVGQSSVFDTLMESKYDETRNVRAYSIWKAGVIRKTYLLNTMIDAV